MTYYLCKECGFIVNNNHIIVNGAPTESIKKRILYSLVDEAEITK